MPKTIPSKINDIEPATRSAPPAHRRIIRIGEVMRRTGGSRTKTWRNARDPDHPFPAPVQIGIQSIGWYEHEIDIYINNLPRVAWAPDKVTMAPIEDEAEVIEDIEDEAEFEIQGGAGRATLQC